MSESQTPRTDAELRRIESAEDQYEDRHDCYCALASFARELETELAATRARLAEEETAHLKTIDERDAAEEAMSRAYFLVFGSSPEWSNQFGYEAANEEIEDAVNVLKQSASRLAESEAAHAELTERYKRTHDLWIASEEEKGNLENEYESLKSRLAEAAGANKEMGDALEKICNMLGAVGPAQAIVEALGIWMENYDKMFAPCENGHGFQAECYGCQRDAALSRLAELDFPLECVRHLAGCACQCQRSGIDVDKNRHVMSCMVGRSQSFLGQKVEIVSAYEGPRSKGE